eukprot:c21927_g1_i1 orf=125-673(+)
MNLHILPLHALSPPSPLCCTLLPSCPLKSLCFCRYPWLGQPLFFCSSFSANGAAVKAGSDGKRRSVSVCKAPSIYEDRFEEEVLQSRVPVLVDFCADWCGPCKLIAPVMDWIDEEYKGTLKVFKIETDANPKLVERYKVYGLPTILLFKDGREVPGSRREGAINKKKLKILVDELLASVAIT